MFDVGYGSYLFSMVIIVENKYWINEVCGSKCMFMYQVVGKVIVVYVVYVCGGEGGVWFDIYFYL